MMLRYLSLIKLERKSPAPNYIDRNNVLKLDFVRDIIVVLEERRKAALRNDYHFNDYICCGLFNVETPLRFMIGYCTFCYKILQF